MDKCNRSFGRTWIAAFSGAHSAKLNQCEGKHYEKDFLNVLSIALVQIWGESGNTENEQRALSRYYPLDDNTELTDHPNFYFIDGFLEHMI